MEQDVIIALDTANETIAFGIGRIDRVTRAIEVVASREVAAFRASNVRLLPEIDALMVELGLPRERVACVVCGRGPGSFTGVRICLASAKGMAIGLGVPLFGVSTADAQAWEQWACGIRGALAIVGDAMRKEVYPVRYMLSDVGVVRKGSDCVMKASALDEWLAAASAEAGQNGLVIAGDALKKYGEQCAVYGTLTPEQHRCPTGRGLLLVAQDAWRAGALDPDDVHAGDPCVLLPVYTRLSDAEEAERRRAAESGGTPPEPKDLESGVQGGAHIRYLPLEASWTGAVASLESQVMGADAWDAAQVIDELPRADRTWWAAFEIDDESRRAVTPDDATLVGYAGGWIVDGQVQLLKIAVDPSHRRHGIAEELVAHVALDARNLGAREMTLEVRVSNEGAQAFYRRLGLACVGVRPRYYSDREDAAVYTGPLPVAEHGVAGMELRLNEATTQTSQRVGRLVLALETSCDETAAALIDEQGRIVSDVVASQIDFHSRFGGVVPEIASRKHIEAIGGVAQECLEQASEHTGEKLTWHDLSAVSVTYAPGLVGALVVGLAFAKGLAWALDVPLVKVNHLEGHLYANKLACPEITPPMVVSLVSGGHTMLVHVRDWGNYETLGSTLDDAVGEAFDKVAKAMGLGYPGGPLISKLAESGNPKAIHFPRALMHSGDLQFSLSGLKTSVMTYLHKEQQAGRPVNQSDVAASFQAAVIDVQVAKARMALEQTAAREFCLGGGVAANPALRHAYERLCKQMGVRLTMPPLSACTDNAAMIALVALDRFRQGKVSGLDCDVAAHASLDAPY